jgi:hypothetical protein
MDFGVNKVFMNCCIVYSYNSCLSNGEESEKESEDVESEDEELEEVE